MGTNNRGNDRFWQFYDKHQHVIWMVLVIITVIAMAGFTLIVVDTTNMGFAGHPEKQITTVNRDW